MKFYTSLLPIIIFGNLFTTNLTVAAVAGEIEKDPTIEEAIESESPSEEKNSEDATTKINLDQYFGCEKVIEEKPEVENITEEDSKAELATKKTECPTQEQIVRFQKLVAADKLYLQGNKIAAKALYKDAKETWDSQEIEINNLPEAIYEANKLSPGGSVYWRTYQQGKKQKLESKIFVPLKLLVTKNPEFIPGHIAYAEELQAYERPLEAIETLEKAIGLYPKESQLLRTKIATDITEKRWLEASISARQFALLNPEHSDSAEFLKLADEYLEEYQDYVREELTVNAISNAIVGTVGFALTGNLFGPISAIDTSIMLLRGESALGERFSKKVQKQLPILEDETVLTYVRNIGNKITQVSSRSEFEYEFHVIMDDSLNAFALPGGKIFVHAGAIMETDSEAELAGLLAHEVAHADLSHGFQLVTRANLTSNVFQYIPYVGSTAGRLIVLNYSRNMERQADIFGTKVLTAADYAADGVRNLMVKLNEQHNDEENPHPPAWLSTHPHTGDRVKYIEEMIISNNLNRYAYEGVEEHQKIRATVKELWEEYKAEQEKEKKEEEKELMEPIDF